MGVTVLGVQHIFYPRSPCGERHRCFSVSQSHFVFLSTLSLRRATITDGSICFDSSFSIHALLAESDETLRQVVSSKLFFYPRSPCGERRKITITVDEGTLFSIHALLAESDDARRF